MATITVTNLNDGGAGSLREALVDAQALPGADTIVFDESLSGGTIRLSARLTTFADEVTINGDIDGDSVADITISGDTDNDGTGDVQFFLNTQTAVTTLNGIAFENGYDSGFGVNVIQNDISATLTITNSSISDTVLNGTSGLVGTIISRGDLTLTNVLIDNAELNLSGAAVGSAGLATFASSTTSVNRVGVTGIATGGDFAALGIINYGTISGGSLGIGSGSADDGTGLINRGTGTGTLAIAISGDSDANVITNETDDTSGTNIILGFGGDDTLAGGLGDDTIYGGAGDDLLVGARLFDGTYGNFGDGFDVLYGGPGNDTLVGGFYADTIFGGDGDDVIRIISNERIDEIDGGEGRDTLDVSAALVRIIVDDNAGELELDGQGLGPQPFSNVEVIIASDGDDFLRDTVSGADLHFEGLKGNDMLEGGDGNDSLFGGLGNDSLTGGAGNDALFATANSNTIEGGGDADLLLGGFDNDTLDGGAGNDVLVGDNTDLIASADRLIGGIGDDLLEGGGGADVFVFAPNEGTDRIGNVTINYSDPTASTISGADFVGGVDQIELSGFALADGAAALAAVSNQGGTATFQAEGTTIIFEGLSASDLSADDFLIV